MIFTKIYLKHAARSLGSLLILSLVVTCISFLFLVSLRAADQFTSISRIAGDAGWQDRVIYTRDTFQDSTAAPTLKEQALIAALPSVQSVETAGLQYLVLDGTSVSMMSFVYTNDAFSRIRYPLSAGQYPAADSYNQVLLPPNMRNQFQVGDKMKVWVVTNVPPGTKIDKIKSATLTVAGFLRENFEFAYTIVYPSADLSHFFVPLSCTSLDLLVVFGIKTDDGAIVPPEACGTYVITPKAGSSVEQVKKDVQSVVEYPAYVHAGPDLFTRYWQANVDSAKPVLAYCIASISLSFTLLLGSTVLTMQRARKTMMIYYNLGLAWPRTVAIFAFQKLPAILLGDVLGILLYTGAGGGGLYPGADGLFLPIYAVITTVIFLLFYTAAILPFYFSAVKKSPMELFGRE